MNRELLFVVVALAAVFVLVESGRGHRRHRRNCPRTESESNGDHWCCDVTTKNKTRWELYWLPCDEIDALQTENGDQHPPEEEERWWENNRKRRSGDYGHKDYCLLWVAYNVTVTYHDWKCCDGWSVDYYGQCSIADGSMDMYCENGGSVVDNSYCVCQEGFIGTHCETPVCTPACQNNGHCSARDGRPVCVCPDNFAGNYCQKPVCSQPCQNGGLCVADACETRCRCKAGYVGKYCEIVIKEGDCPVPHSYGSCQESCNIDSDCIGTHKCCYNGCGHECMKPINSSRCVYNNHTYNVGEQMTRDPCTTCLCRGEGMASDPSGFDCYTRMCKIASCPPGMTLKHVPGQCCGQCEVFECPNGCGPGQCEMQSGNPACRCPHNFRGDSCEIPVCDSPCQNGGTCVTDGAVTHCACKAAYTGPSCEIKLKDKEGVCPSQQQFGTCVESCAYDSDCEGAQKCCSNGCGHVCMDPLHICTLGDVMYRKGETYQRSPCETCECMGQGYGTEPTGFTCHKMMCAMIRCQSGFELKTSADKCCPYCEEIVPPAPAFKECPVKLTIEVNSYNKLVDLKKAVLPKLSAMDGNGQPLEISLSHSQLEHCACPQSQRNIHNVVATTKPDKYGRTATCVMAVKVKDVHPPKFISCPSNIDVFTTEVVTWDKPQHADNVGINSMDFLGSQRNNTRFPVGSFLLGYIARDYEGNVAVCQFKVSVWEEESDDVSMPHQMRKIEEDSVQSNKMFIGIGAALGALITVAVVIALYICCRKSAAARTANNRRPSDTHHDGFDNGIYAIYGPPPPEYDIPGKGKLPEYSNSEPPTYESVDPYPQKPQGVENPTYVTTIDVKLDFDNKVNESLSN